MRAGADTGPGIDIKTVNRLGISGQCDTVVGVDDDVIGGRRLISETPIVIAGPVVTTEKRRPGLDDATNLVTKNDDHGGCQEHRNHLGLSVSSLCN